MISTAEDMAKWLQFHINEGQVSYNGRALLPKEQLLQTYEPEMASPFPMNRRDLWRPKYPVSDINMSYNMGWLTNIYRGEISIKMFRKVLSIYGKKSAHFWNFISFINLIFPC